MGARGRRASGTARLLVLAGVLTVFGLTFAAGVYAGRIWQARSTVVAVRAPDAEPARRGAGRGVKPAEPPAPQLTFYQELTAPLTAPPPPPKPSKTAPPPLVALTPFLTPPPASAAAPAPPLLTVPPAPTPPAPVPAQRPGEQADTLAAVVTAGAPTSVARDGATGASNRPPTERAEHAPPATTNATGASNRPPTERAEHASPATTNATGASNRPPTNQAGLAAPAPTAPAPTNTPRYTIQVASYRVRPPAEALRESLAAGGHDARVVEADLNGAVYRVQVGEFATRDAARAAAARFGGTPYITTR